jgi:hypothetical protein
VAWDDKLGPNLRQYYPKDTQLSVSVENIAFQLFNGVASIYGQTKMQEAQGMLLNIENIGRQGYTYFDAIEDENARGFQRPFMLAIIAPRINYFDSLKIKGILKDLTLSLKKRKDWNPEKYWNKISQVLSTPVV